MTKEQFREQYENKAHAIQSGIKFLMEFDSNISNPKHLRTGLNLVLRDLGSLTGLLVNKGILTEEEVQEALLKGLDEKLRWIELTAEVYAGRKVSFK